MQIRTVTLALALWFTIFLVIGGSRLIDALLRLSISLLPTFVGLLVIFLPIVIFIRLTSARAQRASHHRGRESRQAPLPR